MTKFQEANQCLVGKDYPRAIQLYLEHAEECPTDAAQAYARVAECSLATNVLPAPVSLAPGVTLIHQDDRKTAEHYYRLALEADPRNVKALWGLSQLVPETSKERLNLLERSVAVQPGTLNLVALGDYYRSQLKELERAYEVYKQAQEHAPRVQTAYLRLNDICRRLGRPEEAKEWSQRWREAYARKRRVDGKG